MSADSKPKKRFSVFQSCLVCGLIGIASIGIAAYLTLFRDVPLEVSKETTYITEPLKSNDREVDYFAAWEQEVYPDNIATEDNGYRMIVERIDICTMPDGLPEHFPQLCEKLGLAPTAVASDLAYETPPDYLQRFFEGNEPFDEGLFDRYLPEADEQEIDDDDPWYDSEFFERERRNRLASVLQERVGTPWTLDEFPMMEPWLAENGPALDVVVEAVRKPEFHIPFTRESEDGTLYCLLLRTTQQMRGFASGLVVRANYRIATGDIDGAIDDMVACKRLGRHVGHGGCLVQKMLGLAIEGMANHIGIAGSLEHPPTKEQLQRVLDEWSELPEREPVDGELLFDRFAMLDVAQEIARDRELLAEFLSGNFFYIGPQNEESLFAQSAPYVGFDWNVVGQQINETFDEILATEDYPFEEMSIETANAFSLRSRSKLLGEHLVNMLFPAPQACHEGFHRAQCSDQVFRITLAMLLYECDHGTLPPAYTVDAEGCPLHSWRVLLLPYLGQAELYGEIRLDEPWDSEHNRQFHDEAMDLFRCPSDAKAKPGETTYSVVVGPDMPFEGSKGKKLADFGPESEDMILVVERDAPICWMDPTNEITQADAEAGMNGMNAISSEHPGGANFGLRGGAVRFLSETIDRDVFVDLLKGVNDKWDY